MTKLQWVLLILGSNLPMGAQLLRMKDDNSTGTDDLAADLLDYTSKFLTALQFGLPVPDLPASLRPHVQASLDAASESDITSSAR